MNKEIRAVVTGGAGFIGSHLVEQLLKLDINVAVIDNLACGSLKNLSHLADNPKFEFHELDINDREKLGDVFKNTDWVFHLAGLADIVPSIQEPLKYHRANVEGTLSVLMAAQTAKVKRFVYAASSSCYGIPDNYPTSESSELKPMYPYALTKMLGEHYVMHWNQTYKLPALSLRLFNVYGPRSRTSGTYGAVFGVFLAQKLSGSPYTVVGDGTQTRDFTYVTDVARAFIMAAQSEHSGKIMNVGSTNTYSVNKLVELLGGPITYIPKRPGEPDCTFADTKNIEKFLGWKAEVSFSDGVSEMLEHIDLWKEAPLWDKNSIADATKEWFQYLGKPEENK